MRAIDVQRHAATFRISLKINPHRSVNQDYLPRADWEPALRAIGASASGQ